MSVACERTIVAFRCHHSKIVLQGGFLEVISHLACVFKIRNIGRILGKYIVAL